MATATTATTATKKAWCVYASSQVDSCGRSMSFGDGITASSRRLYALCDSREEAERTKSRFESGKLLTRPRVPGDGRLYPDLSVDRYEPLDFVGRQDRDTNTYGGKHYAALCGDLAARATRNAQDLA